MIAGIWLNAAQSALAHKSVYTTIQNQTLNATRPIDAPLITRFLSTNKNQPDEITFCGQFMAARYASTVLTRNGGHGRGNITCPKKSPIRRTLTVFCSLAFCLLLHKALWRTKVITPPSKVPLHMPPAPWRHAPKHTFSFNYN